MAIKSPAFNSEELKVFSLDTEIILSVLDKKATMLKVSRAWQEKFHVMEANETKDSLFDFVHADDREALERCFGTALIEGKISQHISRFVDDSLTTYYVQFDLTLKDDKVYFVGFDVTKSQEEHQAFVEMSKLSKTGAWYHDPIRDETFWSDEIYRIHDLEIGSEVDSDRVLSFFNEPYKMEIHECIERLYSQGESYDHTGEIVTAKGRKKWIRTIANPVVHQGKVIFVHGVTTDQTRFRKYLAKVEELAETQNLALKGVRSGLFDYNVEDGVIFLSETFRNMVGLDDERAQIPAASFRDLLYKEDRKEAMDRFFDGIQASGNYHFNHFRIKNARTNEVNYYEVHGWMKKNDEGRTVRMVGNLINVHDRVLLQKDAFRTLKSLEAMVDNGFIYSLLLDRRGVIVLADGKSLEVIKTEYNLDPRENEVYYKDVMPRAFQESFLKSFKKALKGEFERKEIERPLLDGAMQWLDIMYRPIFDENGEVEFVLSNGMDISDRKKAELASKSAEERAKSLNQLKAVILSNLSHELRTPLSGIMGTTDLLLNQIEDQEHRKLLEAQKASSIRILKQLTDLISLSDLDTIGSRLKLKKYSLNELTLLCYDMYNHQANLKKLDFKISVSDKSPTVKVDKEMFVSALTALINNALKYTEKGVVEVIVSQKREKGIVEVRDTGRGIAKENFKRIFEDFEQENPGLHQKYEGAGIGLSVAKKFLSMMGGELLLKSKLGEGSVFTISIPVEK